LDNGRKSGNISEKEKRKSRENIKAKKMIRKQVRFTKKTKGGGEKKEDKKSKQRRKSDMVCLRRASETMNESS